MEKDSDMSDQNSATNEETEIPMAAQVLMWILTIAATFYAVKTRSLEDFIRYGSYIVISLSTIILLVFVFNIIRSGITNIEWRLTLLMLIIIPISLCIGAITFYSIFVLFKDIILWIISPTLSKTSAIALSVLTTVIVGLILFYFRLKARAIYGTTEAAVGLIVSVERVINEPNQITTPGFYFAILTAAVYLFVRGLDNIHQGLTKEPIDPFGSKIYAFLKKKT